MVKCVSECSADVQRRGCTSAKADDCLRVWETGAPAAMLSSKSSFYRLLTTSFIMVVYFIMTLLYS